MILYCNINWKIVPNAAVYIKIIIIFYGSEYDWDSCALILKNSKFPYQELFHT